MINIEKFIKKVDDFIYHLDGAEGNKLRLSLKQEDKIEINKSREAAVALVALNFLVIPFLSTDDIKDLLKNEIIIGLSIKDFDITERITNKLIQLDLRDRDNCKEVLKKALNQNTEIITRSTTNESNQELKEVNEWIKDYLSFIRTNKSGTLADAQYFYKKTYFKNLRPDDKELVKRVLLLYKYLDTSSMTPQGFEDDVLLRDEEGRLVTTNKGKVVVLYDPKNKSKSLEKPKARTVGIPKTLEEKSIDELKLMLDDYFPGSLERKAIEEEIKRVSKGM